MKDSSTLVYSDNVCCAFMAAIVAAYEKYIGKQHYLGRTAMQKLVYFAKVLDVPIPCSFEIYTYGPYSETVTFSIDSLLADDVLKDVSQKADYSNYRLGENGRKILTKYSDQIRPYQNRIDSIIKCLGGFEPKQLELVATLHFIHQRKKQLQKGTNPRKQDIVEEFRRVKKSKFSCQEVDSWYSALEDANLL